MRIISGEYGGRRFDPPKGLSARPTTDRAKEGLFNWLQHRMELDGIRFLDLFAGTGNISYELLSRGGTGVAVERERKAVAFIKKTLQELGTSELKVIPRDVNSYLSGPPEAFDLIFLDPPYAISSPLDLINRLLDDGWLKSGGYIILEHYDKVSTEHPCRVESRNYGQSVFSIFTSPAN